VQLQRLTSLEFSFALQRITLIFRIYCCLSRRLYSNAVVILSLFAWMSKKRIAFRVKSQHFSEQSLR